MLSNRQIRLRSASGYRFQKPLAGWILPSAPAASPRTKWASPAPAAPPAAAQSVIIGTIGASPNESFGITRYNADGSLDTSFGGGGVVSTSFAGTDDKAAALAVLPGGQILVAGTATTYVDGIASGSQFAVAEYNADGSPNTAFGGGTGQVLVSFSNTAGTLSNDTLHAMILGPGGVIYLGGSSDAGGAGQDFALAALNADGSADASFASGGKTLLDFAGGDDSIAALALQANGEIIAAGSATASGVASLALADFLPAGAIELAVWREWKSHCQCPQRE